MTWISDNNGNKCSVEYFGTKEAARVALDSLKNCDGCINCSDCSGCSRCSRCSRCSDCSGCSRCSGCSGCSRCSGCSDCSGCSRCSGCLDCSGCSRCSRCSRCSGCSDCSGCSGCSGLFEKKDYKAAPAPSVKRVIPVIPDIHKAIYAAVSKPGALDMGAFHTCETTHCRAGWAVALAGDPGRALEEYFNTELAAMLIYRESGYQINPCRFYDGNEAAMADMKRLAEVSE